MMLMIADIQLATKEQGDGKSESPTRRRPEQAAVQRAGSMPNHF